MTPVPATRNIVIPFRKSGPFRYRGGGGTVIGIEGTDPSHIAGETWIDEDISLVHVRIAVSFFPMEENEDQIWRHVRDWQRTAEEAIRQNSPDEKIIFQDEKSRK